MSNQKENLKISILVPIDHSVKKSLSLALLSNTINNKIQIQDIAPSIDIQIKSLVVDRKECLIMEIKKLEEQINPPIGFSIYSNSIPTVLSYSSIFEMICNRSILAQELKHEGEVKDDFINTAAHELRTPTQAISGYTEMNDELFGILKDREKMTDEEQARIIVKLHEHH